LAILTSQENKLVRCFNFKLGYIDDALSLNNFQFGDFVDRIYPTEFEIKDTTDTAGLLHTLTCTSKLTVMTG